MHLTLPQGILEEIGMAGKNPARLCTLLTILPERSEHP